MFELTNDQRKCFALEPIHDQWVCIEAKPSPYDQFKTYLYLDGDTIVKCILSGDSQYCEYELSEKVSPDRKYLLPKTTKGKPTLLSSSTIQKRNAHISSTVICVMMFAIWTDSLDGLKTGVKKQQTQTLQILFVFLSKNADTFVIKKAMYSASRLVVGYMATEESFLIMIRCGKRRNPSGISL